MCSFGFKDKLKTYCHAPAEWTDIKEVGEGGKHGHVPPHFQKCGGTIGFVPPPLLDSPSVLIFLFSHIL